MSAYIDLGMSDWVQARTDTGMRIPSTLSELLIIYIFFSKYTPNSYKDLEKALHVFEVQG
jgi:hypothetical protein